MGTGCSIVEKNDSRKSNNNKNKQEDQHNKNIKNNINIDIQINITNLKQSQNKYEINKIIPLKSYIFSIIYLGKNKLATGCSDNLIRIWDTQSTKLLSTLYGHSNSVLCLSLYSPEILLSGSDKEIIKAWNLDNLLTLKTFDGGDDYYINSIIKLPDNEIASSSNDKHIKIWDYTNGTVILKLSGHNYAVYSLLSIKSLTNDNEKLLISASADFTIKIWSLKSKASFLEEALLLKHDNRVNVIIEFTNNRIISGSDDKKVKVWCMDTYTCINTFEGHSDKVTCLTKLNNSLVASGGNDKKIIIWNINEQSIFKILDGHSRHVRGLVLLSESKFASFGYDKLVNIWNI